MKVEDQCELFREILLTFFDADYATRSKINLFYDVRPYLPSSGYILSSREFLESRLPKVGTPGRVSGNFSGGFLCLKPVIHGNTLLPVLTMNYNFGCSIPKISLRVGLYLKHDEEVKAVGYRFESPEGIGRHHYYHVQMIKGFTTDTFFPPELSTVWLPDAEPTFPLDARDSVDLILCLLLSLYGMTEFKQFILNLTQSSRKIVLEKVNELNMGKFTGRKIVSYWCVTSRASGKAEYYETEYEPDDFRKHINHDHTGHECSEIMPGEWERQTVADKKVCP